MFLSAKQSILPNPRKVKGFIYKLFLNDPIYFIHEQFHQKTAGFSCGFLNISIYSSFWMLQRTILALQSPGCYLCRIRGTSLRQPRHCEPVRAWQSPGTQQKIVPFPRRFPRSLRSLGMTYLWFLRIRWGASISWCGHFTPTYPVFSMISCPCSLRIQSINARRSSLRSSGAGSPMGDAVMAKKLLEMG